MSTQKERQEQPSFDNILADGLSLYTRRWLPEKGTPKACVLFLHGFVEHIGRYESKFSSLASKDIQVTAYDQRGFGQTNLRSNDPASSYSKTTWSQQLADLEVAVRAERKKLDADYGESAVPLFLSGQCMGASNVLSFFTRPESEAGPSAEARSMIFGVILTSPWLRLTKPPPFFVAPMAGLASRWYPLMKMSAGMPGKELTSDTTVQASIDADPLCAQEVYLKTLTEVMNEGNALAKDASKLWPSSLPVLALHGDADDITSCKATETFITQLLAKDKSFHYISSGRHKLWDEPNADDVVDLIEEWISARLPQSTTDTNLSGTTLAHSATLPKALSACWATLLTHDKLLPGLVVFATSLLKNERSKYPLVVMVTETLSQEGRGVVESLGCRIRDIQRIDPVQETTSMSYARFREAWSKLRAFELVDFDRVVLVDTDMLVRRNMDELMELPLTDGNIAASFACTCNPARISSYPKDWTPENCPFTPQEHPSCLTKLTQITDDSPRTYHLLNSGLVILKPSRATMESMITRIQTDPVVPTYALPDQDFLADYFRFHFQPLPWTYNALKTLRGCHERMWRDEEVRNVHYILVKPWEAGPPAEAASDNISVLHRWWWDAWKKSEETKAALSDEAWQMVASFVRTAEAS